MNRSERMILNNYLTMKRVGELQSEEMTPELLLELHRLVTDRALDDPSAAGRFRRSGEDVAVYENDHNRILHTPPPASALAARMDRLCAFGNGSDSQFIHPVIRSIILHFMIGYDHPFVDGNGRTARALFYWSMLKHKYWLAEYLSISTVVLKAPARYGMAYLYSETDENDLTYFILYHLRIVMEAIEELHRYIAHKTAEVRRAESELRGIETLNHRQRDLIRNAVRHPGRRYTMESHRSSHGVAYETARSDLLELVERGLLRHDTPGPRRKMTFVAMPDLAVRLAAVGVPSAAAPS